MSRAMLNEAGLALPLDHSATGTQQSVVQRTLARQRRTIRPRQLRLPRHRPDRRILPQPVMVVEILSSQRQRRQPLTNQRLHRMHRQQRAAKVLETARQPRDQIQSRIRNAVKDHIAIGGQRAARKSTSIRFFRWLPESGQLNTLSVHSVLKEETPSFLLTC